MSYTIEREDFIARVTQEGLPLHVARLLLREATGLNRRAELACSSEAADRDRVPCPRARYLRTHKRVIGNGLDRHPCLCDNPMASETTGDHERVPRIAVQDWHAEERIRKALGTVNAANKPIAPATRVEPWTFQPQGDPRGYVLRVIPPSYAARNAGKDRHNLDAIGVPNRPSRLRW